MLKETLEKIIGKIRDFRPLYEQNEMAVGLGWNPENPEDVQPNVSTEEGIPDYSLIKDGRKVLFIEAKKLSVNVEQKEIIRQLAKYCFAEGVKYGVLTNGAIWIFFRAFQEGTTMTDRIVWKVDVENDKLTTSIARLNTISKDNINDVEELIKKLQILDELWKSLIDDPGEMIKGFIPVFERLLREKYADYQFELDEIEGFLKEKIKELITPVEGNEPLYKPVSPPELYLREGKQPRKIKIDNDVFEIKYSFEILTNTAEWLIRKGKLKSNDCPVVIGNARKRYLINVKPKHKHGDKFRAPKRLSNGLYIDTNYSTKSCIKVAKRLLEKFGFKGDILKVY